MHTFFNNFTDEDFGESSDDLSHWLGNLLTNDLLNDLLSAVSQRSPMKRIFTRSVYFSNRLLWQSMPPIRFEPVILGRAEVVHQNSTNNNLWLIECTHESFREEEKN